MQTILDFICKILVLFKLSHKSWLVKVLVLAGVAIVAQSLWLLLIEISFEIDLSTIMPDPAHGWALILLGMLVFLLNRHDALSLDTLNTEETSQIISLGDNRFSISFPRPMRCSPTMTFSEPSKIMPNIENWSAKGLTVDFPKSEKVTNVKFIADAKPGLPLWWYKLMRKLK
jgi:hypothetical protein